MVRVQCLALCAVMCAWCFSTGCAFSDQKVQLCYADPVAEATGSGPVEVAKPVAPSLETNKKGLAIIGNVKNTYGMKTADSVTESSPSDWVAQALEAELASAGYEPQMVDSLSPAAARGIETRIIKVWVEQDPGFWTVGALGQVQLRMALYQNGQMVKEFDIDSQGQGERGVFGDATTKAGSMQAALEACMKEAVPVIAETFGGGQQ